MATVKRRKKAADRKEVTLRVRLTTEQRELFDRAAAAKGLETSSWVRTVAIDEAKRVIADEE